MPQPKATSPPRVFTPPPRTCRKLFGLRRRTSVGKYLHEQLPGVTIVVISPPDFSGC